MTGEAFSGITSGVSGFQIVNFLRVATAADSEAAT
jgi:hypothetical protein